MRKYRLCPCGSGRGYSSCCEPLILGKGLPLIAEQLMRSRYTAYITQAVDYILETWHPSTRPQSIDVDSLTEWEKLYVMRTEKGGEDDDAGTVEFEAVAADGGTLHEVSRFVKEDGRWLYLDGNFMNAPQVEAPAQPVTVQKVGRNEPCPCGSGKKYKKCCGR